MAGTRGTPEKRAREAFLRALDETGMVTAACDATGIPRRTAYNWRDSDEAFRERWTDIVERTTEQMEREAQRRAVEGWTEREIFDEDGNTIGEVRKYSDTLLIFLLKGRRPDVYRDEHRVEHAVAADQPLQLEISADVAKAAHVFLDNVRRERENTS